MLFGYLKMKQAGEDEGLQQAEKPAEQMKSPSPEAFMKTPEAQNLVKKWTAPGKDGKPMYTKRGLLSLLRSLFQIPGLSSDKEVIEESDTLLKLLGGMDGLQGFLAGWKAKSEGIMKGIKGLFKI